MRKKRLASDLVQAGRRLLGWRGEHPVGDLCVFASLRETAGTAEHAVAVDAPIARLFAYERQWRRATAQRRWLKKCTP